MKLIKRISCYFDRISYEIRIIRRKHTLIFMGIFLLLGIFSWILGGKTDRVMLLYSFPRAAIGIGFMFILWGFSFMFCGCIFAGIAFSCERYRRHISQKICLYIILMQLFTLIAYPLFFGAIAPFIAFLSLIISIFFCIMAILSSIKFFTLWTVFLSVHILWLFYNAYICLAFIFIN